MIKVQSGTVREQVRLKTYPPVRVSRESSESIGENNDRPDISNYDSRVSRSLECATFEEGCFLSFFFLFFFGVIDRTVRRLNGRHRRSRLEFVGTAKNVQSRREACLACPHAEIMPYLEVLGFI